jgi:hypothetical protein
MGAGVNRQVFGDLDLGTLEPLVVGGAVVGSLLWLAAAAFLYAFRAPSRPPTGLLTLALGPESPAVANFLVNGFEVTDEAAAATVLDLAARDLVEVEQRGPDVFYVRVRPDPDVALTACERRVLAVIERRSRDEAVPVEAVTTGSELASKEWRRAFSAEVVAEAQALGLSREALDSRAFGVLVLAFGIPAGCIWAVWGLGPAVVAVGAAAALLGWLYTRHPQRETPAGLEAASRWLGVRAELATNPVFDTHSPLTVELWDRLLAYGAALGVARGASGPLPLRAEADTVEWSNRGGRWREITISYPKLWPPGWGAEPGSALAVGLVAAGAAGYWLYRSGVDQLDVGPTGWLSLLVSGVAVVVGVAVVIVASSDLATAVEVTGPILRLRSFGGDDKPRYYVAVDDGESTAIKAFRVTKDQFEKLREGDVVTVRTTERLGRVRWIVPAPTAV